MERNEIKKALYKEKPTAIRTDRVSPEDAVTSIRLGYSRYQCLLSSGDRVIFVVPFEEMGENEFEDELPAQLLIRWLR